MPVFNQRHECLPDYVACSLFITDEYVCSMYEHITACPVNVLDAFVYRLFSCLHILGKDMEIMITLKNVEKFSSTPVECSSIKYTAMKMSKITTELLVRFFENRTSPAENDMIADWIESDPANQEIFNRELKYHLMLMHVYAADAPAKDSASAPRSRRSRFIMFSGTAAAMVITFLVSWFVGVSHLRDEADRMMTFSTRPGQRASLVLPDGSVVELNSGSSLEYPAVFSKRERRVRIEGEALFDVAKDERRPFMVETFAYDIKVLGTRFDVIAEEESGEFCTALMEGKVAILDKESIEVVRLAPDQIAKVIDGKLHKIQEDDVASQYRWAEGIVSCGGLTFVEMMWKFERAFGVNIVVECENIPDIHLKRMKLNVNDGIIHAFSVLRMFADFEYVYDDRTNTYYIR